MFAANRETKKMPHYEVIAIIHPDQHARAGEMADRYKKIVADGGGIVHRFEDWGLRPLAYPMRKQRRAQYILLNIECEPKTLGELQENFRFSDAVMRSMVVRCEEAIVGDSPMKKKIEEEKLAAQAEAENRAKAAAKAAEIAKAEKERAEKAAKEDKADKDKADKAAKAEADKAEAKGDKGDKGDKGAKGAKGEQGDKAKGADAPKDEPKAEGETKAKGKKQARKEKAERQAEDDEADKSIKAPRKSAAKSRRAVADDEGEEEE